MSVSNIRVCFLAFHGESREFNSMKAVDSLKSSMGSFKCLRFQSRWLFLYFHCTDRNILYPKLKFCGWTVSFLSSQSVMKGKCLLLALLRFGWSAKQSQITTRVHSTDVARNVFIYWRIITALQLCSNSLFHHVSVSRATQRFMSRVVEKLLPSSSVLT